MSGIGTGVQLVLDCPVFSTIDLQLHSSVLSSLLTSFWRVANKTPLASRGSLKCVAMYSTDFLTSAKLQLSSSWISSLLSLSVTVARDRFAHDCVSKKMSKDCNSLVSDRFWVILSCSHWSWSSHARHLLSNSFELLSCWVLKCSSLVRHAHVFPHLLRLASFQLWVCWVEDACYY